MARKNGNGGESSQQEPLTPSPPELQRRAPSGERLRPRADLFLVICRIFGVITALSAILCIVVNVFSAIRSFKDGSDVFDGIFRCYAVVVAVFVILAETEWSLVFKFWMQTLATQPPSLLFDFLPSLLAVATGTETSSSTPTFSLLRLARGTPFLLLLTRAGGDAAVEDDRREEEEEGRRGGRRCAAAVEDDRRRRASNFSLFNFTLFKQQLILEYWVGRGMLQIFVAVMTRAFPDYSDEEDILVLLQNIACYMLLACGVIYVVSGILCMGILKRARQKKEITRDQAVNDLEELERRRHELEALLI